MAFIEIGIWWNPDRGRKTDFVAPLLVRPHSYRTPDGQYEVGWEPLVPGVFPTPF